MFIWFLSIDRFLKENECPTDLPCHFAHYNLIPSGKENKASSPKNPETPQHIKNGRKSKWTRWDSRLISCISYRVLFHLGCTSVPSLPGKVEPCAPWHSAPSNGSLRKKSDRGPEGRGGSRATAWQGLETSGRGQPAPSTPPTTGTFQKHRSFRRRQAQSTIVCRCAHDWFYSQAGIKWETQFPYQTRCFCAIIGLCATFHALPQVWGSLEGV